MTLIPIGRRPATAPKKRRVASPVGALRVLLEAGGNDASARPRPQSAPGVQRQAPFSQTGRRPSTATLTRSLPVAQYSSPLSMSGPLLRPRSASSGATLRERRLGLADETDPCTSSWADLENSKVRVVSILDRLEYLKHLQSGLTSLSSKHSDELRASSRQSRAHMRESLRHNTPKIERMLETQRTLMKIGGTASKRLDKLHRYVVTQEQHRMGDAGAEAARASAASFGAGAGQSLGEFEVPKAAIEARERSQSPEPKNESAIAAAAAAEEREGEGDSTRD